MPDQLDPSLDELAMPQQPLYPKGVREQQRVSAPIGSMLGDLVKQFNDQIGQTMLSSDPTRVDDPGAYGAADLARQTLGAGYLGAPGRQGVGMLGGKLVSALSPEESAKLNNWLKNPEHLNEYFAGMHNPRTLKFLIDHPSEKGKKVIEFEGPLYHGKENVGLIWRKIYPEERQAYHANMSIDDEWKGQGFGKKLSLSHLGVYQKTGIEKSGVYAVDEGGSFWAHLGYLPDKIGWDEIKTAVRDKLGLFDLATQNSVNNILKSNDPRAIWDLADHPAGRKLLTGVPWRGIFDITNPEQVERMNINARR